MRGFLRDRQTYLQMDHLTARQVLHHCRIHVRHLHPPRYKLVDSIQPRVLLERTKGGLKRHFKDKTGVLWWHCGVFRSCFETYERIAHSWVRLVELSHPRQRLSAGPGANWHRAQQGVLQQAAVTGKMIRHIALRAFIIRGNSRE